MRCSTGIWAIALAATLIAALAAMGAAASPPTQDRAWPVHASAEAYRAASLSGGPPKDGIPAIDEPEFWSASDAAAYLDGDDIVLGVHHAGAVRAYPRRILVWHEIVNDRVGGQPVSITYCPLTGTALGFLRGETTFGVSGRLVNSNLIMYDRATDTHWPQILATGIGGTLEGASLHGVQVVWTTWSRWRERFPETRVLSTDTGYVRDYRRDPYGGYGPREGYYRPGAATIFPLMARDDRYPPKTVFVVARTEEGAIAFRKSSLREAGVMHGSVGAERLTAIYDDTLDAGFVFRNPTGAEVSRRAVHFGDDGVQAADPADELEAVLTFDAMWFAFAAFYPEGVVRD